MILDIVDGKVGGLTVACNVCEGVQRHDIYWEVASHCECDSMRHFLFL